MLKEEGEHANSDKKFAEISNEKGLVRHTNFSPGSPESKNRNPMFTMSVA
jgi:hypothetical protein